MSLPPTQPFFGDGTDSALPHLPLLPQSFLIIFIPVPFPSPFSRRIQLSSSLSSSPFPALFGMELMLIILLFIPLPFPSLFSSMEPALLFLIPFPSPFWDGASSAHPPPLSFPNFLAPASLPYLLVLRRGRNP